MSLEIYKALSRGHFYYIDYTKFMEKPTSVLLNKINNQRSGQDKRILLIIFNDGVSYNCLNSSDKWDSYQWFTATKEEMISLISDLIQYEFKTFQPFGPIQFSS